MKNYEAIEIVLRAAKDRASHLSSMMCECDDPIEAMDFSHEAANLYEAIEKVEKSL